jgi:hypothetical protein
MRVLWAAAFIVALSTTLALAEEPIGCDKFKWPVDKEIAALRAPNLQEVKSSTKVSAIPFAGTVLLVPSSSASLPKERSDPQRAIRFQAICPLRTSPREHTQSACRMLLG